jgi:hypothetical protein
VKNFSRTIAVLLACAIFAPVSMAKDVESEYKDIESFVRQVYFHGVDYNAALAFDSANVPALFEMLKNPDEERYWANIAVTICMIASEDSLDELIAFIERVPASRLSPESAQHLNTAQTSALMGLGYLLNRTGSQKALEYLQRRLSPSSWTAIPKEHDKRDMSKYAALALGLAGTESAANALIAFRDNPPNSEARAFLSQESDTLEQALIENRIIRQFGMATYDRNIKKQ